MYIINACIVSDLKMIQYKQEKSEVSEVFNFQIKKVIRSIQIIDKISL